MHPNLVAEEVSTATLHYDERIKSNPVEQCFVGIDELIQKSYPAEAASSGDPGPDTRQPGIVLAARESASTTIFRITDRDMSKQLSVLQFPGRYAKLDLPAPAQT